MRNKFEVDSDLYKTIHDERDFNRYPHISWNGDIFTNCNTPNGLPKTTTSFSVLKKMGYIREVPKFKII